jgi:hypothetical protein
VEQALLEASRLIDFLPAQSNVHTKKHNSIQSRTFAEIEFEDRLDDLESSLRAFEN